MKASPGSSSTRAFIAGWLAMLAFGALAAGLVQPVVAATQRYCADSDLTAAIGMAIAAPAFWAEIARSPALWSGAAAASLLAGLALLCWPRPVTLARGH